MKLRGLAPLATIFSEKFCPLSKVGLSLILRKAEGVPGSIAEEESRMTKHSTERPGQPLPRDEKVSRLLRSLASTATSETGEFALSEDMVRDALSAWRERARYLPQTLFSDFAWGILLDLLLAEVGKRPMTLSRVCKGCGGSASTAMRWVHALEDHELIVRRADPGEPGSEFVELTIKASAALRCYFRGVH